MRNGFRCRLIYWIGCIWIAAGLNLGCAKTLPTIDKTPLGETLEEIDPAAEVAELTAEISAGESVAGPALRITVNGARSADGVYSLALFADEESFIARERPTYSAEISAADSPAVWELESVEAGTYALAVYHDENENEVLDRHKLGVPLEAYGFSNNARGKFGPPPYGRVKFEISSDTIEQNIKIK